jgi:hypothetical protein
VGLWWFGRFSAQTKRNRGNSLGSGQRRALKCSSGSSGSEEEGAEVQRGSDNPLGRRVSVMERSGGVGLGNEWSQIEHSVW